MNSITLEEFIECYKPICNECTPYPEGYLKTKLGNIIWDFRDYDRVAVYLNKKQIWTIWKETVKDKEGERDIYISGYTIKPEVSVRDNNDLIGYIVTEVPYNSNDIGNLEVKIGQTKI